MKHWWSSDLHLLHHNIIRYDKRPFKDVYHMGEHILDSFNRNVSPEDELYLLGDLGFAHGNEDKKWMDNFLSELNGKKFFIKGNHDHKDIRKLYEKHGTYLGELHEKEINGQLIIMCHYAMRVWNKSHRGSWHLYGHSHHSLPDDPNSLSFDVGCNGWDYEPLEFEQVKEIMAKKTYKPIDHHGQNNR